MSGSVTPARRQREEEDEEDSEVEDFEPSIDGEASPRSSAHKRPRLYHPNGAEEDAEDDSNDGSNGLLPDNYRRSPRARGRLANIPQNGEPPLHHKPGSIVRVALVNFVTYTRTEFHPGPNLNMIIGPNGTGKSTLVCAICLGLGWSTQHLGRAKDLGEFVKHGAKTAEIQIELAKDPERQHENPVIKTTITKDGNKADYAINRKKSNKKGVQQLARSFSIQVDNLCQFLPQDRVVEFAALSAEDLLSQTLRAAAPEYMTEWHNELKEMRKEQKSQQEEQQKLMESLKQDENRQRLQEADVVRLRERGELQERKTILEKLRPFPEYAVAKQKHADAKTRKKEAERELRQLGRNAEPNLQAVHDKQTYLERIQKVGASRQRLVARQENVVADNKTKIDNAQRQIDDCAQDINGERQTNSKNRQNADRLRTEIAGLQKAMQSPPEPFDPAGTNEQIRDRTRRIRDIEARNAEVRREIDSINEQGRQRNRVIEQCKRDKEDLLSQAGQQSNKLQNASRDAATAWRWIQSNRDRFESEVFGPPIIACKVKDPRYASAVESIIPEGEKLAFTVTTEKDFKMLNEQLYQVMKLNQINIRNSPNPLSSFRSPLSTEELQQNGFECWILDMLEGPEAVLAMLCDNARIQQAAYTSGDISNAQFTALQRTSLTTWATTSSTFQIVRRREYGDQAMSTRVNPLKPAKYFTETPIDVQQEEEIEAREREALGERGELHQRMKELAEEGKRLGIDRAKLKDEQEALQKDKDEKQARHAVFNGLPAKEQRAREKLEAVEELLNGTRERIQAIVDRCDTLTVAKGQLALDYANSIEALRGLHISLFETEILQVEAESDLQQLQVQHAEEAKRLAERETEVAELTEVAAQLLVEGRRLQAICGELGANFTDEETEIWTEVVNDGRWTSDQLETEIQSVQARLEMTHGGGNQNTLREFEERASRIETKRAKLGDLEQRLKDLFERLEELRGRWEPRLDELIARISEAFADNFARIQCAGEVAVHKDEDFEQWAVQIKVKFRESEQLSILDSHRQSGGERAVSTIFYLMALQSLARAPFRVVDEINQGMDPRNERLVHSRMVDIACAEHTSQYFLITPKLLSGLKYHPNMKVHCIASGEYMPSDHRELEFGALAKKALAMRNGVGGRVEVAV